MASSRLLTILLLFISAAAFSQKNVTDATKSELTGISLPAGSKQDKRILSTASAKALLDITAKEIGRECSGSAEVIYLPIDNEEKQSVRVKKLLTQEGYNITEVAVDIKYSVISLGDKNLLIFIEDTKTGADMYISALTVLPVAVAPPASNVSAHQTVETKTTNIPPSSVAATGTAAQATQEPPKPFTKELPSPASLGGFKFTATNFDDGWTSIQTDEYVKISKDKIVARIYYPVEMTEQMRPPVIEARYYFWNLIVIPQFTVKNLWEWKEQGSFFQSDYLYAEAIEKSTGTDCYIGLNISFSSGGATPVLAIAPDKQTYDSQFSKPENILKMLGYNKFAVALSDLTGTWVGGDNSVASYYNSVTGNFAGMNFVSMSDQFTFSANGDYTSKHSGASGMIGNTTAYNQEYKGKAIVSNWEIILTNRWEGKTDTFEAWFEGVHGGRMLRLVNKQYTGIKYNLFRKPKD
jgi:hypothetical protein